MIVFILEIEVCYFLLKFNFEFEVLSYEISYFCSEQKGFYVPSKSGRWNYMLILLSTQRSQFWLSAVYFNSSKQTLSWHSILSTLTKLDALKCQNNLQYWFSISVNIKFNQSLYIKLVKVNVNKTTVLIKTWMFQKLNDY